LLLRTIVTLSLLIAVLLAAIIGATYRDTNRFAYLFTNPNGSRCETPCLLGIDLTTASFEDFDDFILHRSGVPFVKQIEIAGRIVYDTPDIEIAVESYALNPELRLGEGIMSLTIKFKTSRPSVGELLLAFSKSPRNVSVSNRVNILQTCHYLNVGYSHSASFIEVASRGSLECILPNLEVANIKILPQIALSGVRWTGFIPFQQYLNAIEQYQQEKPDSQ
jgi:hypothetical protein